MFPSNQRVRRSLLVGIVVITLAVTGCTSAPVDQGPTPSPATSEPPATTSEPDAPDDDEDQFTDATLSQICIEATTSAFGTEIDFAIDDARIEERTVEPRWLVLVPAHASDYTGEAQCTIGGTPSSPIVEMSSASLNPLPENQIQNLINGLNEGGTD